MKKRKNSTVKALMIFSLIVLCETMFHLLISLTFQIIKYDIDGLFVVKANTGLSRIENLSLTVLGLLGLRLFFLELLIKLVLEFSNLTNQMKMIISVLLSLIFVFVVSSFFFRSFQLNDVTDPKRGWFLFLPLSVLFVSLTRIFFSKKSKSENNN